MAIFTTYSMKLSMQLDSPQSLQALGLIVKVAVMTAIEELYDNETSTDSPDHTHSMKAVTCRQRQPSQALRALAPTSYGVIHGKML